MSYENIVAATTKNGEKLIPPPIKPRISVERKRLEMELKKQMQLRANIVQREESSLESQQQVTQPLLTTQESVAKKCGFLQKTGPSRKRFQKRWFIVCHEMISYFTDEPSRSSRATPKGAIALSDVLFISIYTTNEKSKNPPGKLQRNSGTSKSVHNRQEARNSNEMTQDQCYFNVAVNSQQGRIYLFAADCSLDRQSWIRCVAERIAPQHRCKPLPDKVDCCGYLHVKLGISGMWTTSFVILSDKTLTIQTELQQEVPLDNKLIEVDLRKVMSVLTTTAHHISSCGAVGEIGQPICLNRPYDTAIYIQGDFKNHTEIWYQLLVKAWTVPPKAGIEQQLLTPSDIPVAVDKCLNFISTYGGLTTKSIYRQSGEEVAVKSILSSLRDPIKLWDWHIRPEDGFTVHDVAAAFKSYLLSFPECILGEELFSSFIENNKIENREERLRKLKSLLKKLSSISFNTLKKIVCHFCYLIENADKNEMNIVNISVVMGPVLIYSAKIVSDITSAMDILTDLVTCYSWLFDVTQEEMEKERKIQRTLVSLRETRIRSSKPGGDILVGVFIYNREWGKCLNVPVTPTMTAEELITYAREKCNLKDPIHKLSVFEAVCDGQLERILHYSEVVLGVTLFWTTNWPPEDAKNNYLIIKTNEIYDKLSPFLNQKNTRTSTIPLSLFSELKFSDFSSGKTFRKVLFEFIGARLNIYKDAKADKVIGQWNIEDIIWYLGAETKRNAPNKFSITFIDRYKPVVRGKESCGFVGRTVCCNTEHEYYQWIAGMIISEYPNGVHNQKKPVDLLTAL